MSYVRFAPDSDVYVFESCSHPPGRPFECCGCALGPGFHYTATEAEMIEHLQMHAAAGHAVPERAFDALRAGRGFN